MHFHHQPKWLNGQELSHTEKWHSNDSPNTSTLYGLLEEFFAEDSGNEGLSMKDSMLGPIGSNKGILC